MAIPKFKLETGLQMLSRLIKKPDIHGFYPILFQDGPKHEEVIEIFSNGSTMPLLVDIICDALLLKTGETVDVLIFNTDGNFSYDYLMEIIKEKINQKNVNCVDKKSLNTELHESLSRLHLFEIYDSTQFYTSIYNLESVLSQNCGISLIIFTSLTAFYWSEQGFKITKMDLYIKSLLKIIQKVTKEYKITLIYTRPEHFSSSKELIENLEPCLEHPTPERVNYRVQILYRHNEPNEVILKTYNMHLHKYFNLINGSIKWI